MSAIEVKVPAVGESITEVTIAQWMKKDGEVVKKDEVICELESDKATFELTAETSGILKIVAQQGETVPINSLICRIEVVDTADAPVPVAAAVPTATAPSAPAAPTTEARIIDVKIPAVGESINEVTIAVWNKQDGAAVQKDEVLCEIESDKATFELSAEASGILRIVAPAGSTLPIGALVCRIEAGAGVPVAAETAASAPVQQAAATAAGNGYAAGHPSPAAAKILAEKGIAATDVQGSGIGNRITKEDAEKAVKPAATVAPSTPAAASNTTASAEVRGERREKMSNMRKTISRRLVQVKSETAMLTTFNEVDMQPIMDIRAKYKDIFKEKHEIGLGFMSFFTKAVTVALQEWPAVNAYIDGDEIIYHNFCDISVAVSTPKGLVVPVIRNAEQMSLADIEKEIARLAARARDGKLTIPEMTGGTFSITNGGVFGSLMSTPILNSPQSAILGMHNIVQRPVAINNQVVIRPMMYVALSYDHRIIDGRESVSFLVRVKQLLEDPIRLLLNV